MYALQFLAVVVAVAIADMFWTLYFMATAKRHALQAAVWSTLIIFSSAYATTSYVDDKRFIVAAGIGAFVGTYLTVRFKKE